MAYTLRVEEAAQLASSVPILDAMGVRVLEATSGHAVAELPPEPNVNHFGVTYAGSLYSVAEMLGGVLAMVHLWMVGTHMAYLGFKVVIFVLLTTLFRLESLRVAQNIVKNRPVLAGKVSIISIGIWVVATALSAATHDK